MIAIVDYGGANLASVLFALKRLNVDAIVTRDIQKIKNASHVLLPGVGHARVAIQNLQHYGLFDLLKTLTQPVLGICLGMQLLYAYLDEAEAEGFKLIPGKVKRLTLREGIRTPHMGWNRVRSDQNHIGEARFYFVHNYCAPVNSYSLATTHYGETFTSLVKYQNFIGVQFHPEKSSAPGAQFLKLFLKGDI